MLRRFWSGPIREQARSHKALRRPWGSEPAREEVGPASAESTLAYTSLSITKEGCAMDHLVLTVFAPDKPGQVERIAQCIAEHGGNWLESRMSRMAGQFAGILRVGVPAEAYDSLVDALQGLSAHGIRVLIAESGIEQSCTWKPIAMELVGNDRPGIVRDITRLLSEQGVNLERLVTEVRPAPMSSEPLFHAEAILAVPLTLSLDVLQSRLETLADDLMVELVLRSEP
jgi:glycine cleavage system regulatory protein